MKVTYSASHHVEVDDMISVYRRSGINRPVDDKLRMQKMLDAANLVITARDGEKLVGMARCWYDHGWVCYLSDLVVDKSYQRSGIGGQIIRSVQDYIGPQCQLVLLSAPDAMEYYPKVGFEKAHHAFIIRRKLP